MLRIHHASMLALIFTVQMNVAAAPLAPLAVASSASASDSAKNIIVTGGKGNTYYQMASELQKYVSPGLTVSESDGSWDNLVKLADKPGVTFGIVQSDALMYFARSVEVEPDLEAKRRYKAYLGRLRVMLPLHEEELHVLVHRLSPMNYIHEIKGKRIFMGRPNSGAYISGGEVYKTLFGSAPPKSDVVAADSFKQNDSAAEVREALTNLGKLPQRTVGSDVDVVILVGGQPFKAIRALEASPAVAANFKFLAIDPKHAETPKLLQNYSLATLEKKNYPTLLDGSKSSDTLAVQAYLVTAGFKDKDRNEFVDRFAENYCRSYQSIVADTTSHEKWKKVKWKPGQKFPEMVHGWKAISKSTLNLLTNCKAIDPPPPASAPVKKKCKYPSPVPDDCPNG